MKISGILTEARKLTVQVEIRMPLAVPISLRRSGLWSPAVTDHATLARLRYESSCEYMNVRLALQPTIRFVTGCGLTVERRSKNEVP